MSNLYMAPGGQGFLLYENNQEVILRRKEGHQFYQPVVLASDYEMGLQDTIFNSTLYYTYLNKQGWICIRGVSEYVFPYEKRKKEQVTYEQPTLVSFWGKLILFYFENRMEDEEASTRKNETEEMRKTKDGYHTLKGILPYEDEREILSLKCKGTEVTYKTLKTMAGVFVMVESRKGECVFITKDWEIKKGYFLGEDSIWGEKNDKEEQEWQKKIEGLKATVEEKNKAIQYYKGQIERAKQQYGELMEVAEQYKQEAYKWTRKFE